MLCNWFSKILLMSNSGGHTHPRRRLHEPEASAQVHKKHLPDRSRARGVGERRSEGHAQRRLQQPAHGPLRPDRGLSGRARCRSKQTRNTTIMISARALIITAAGLHCGVHPQSCQDLILHFSHSYGSIHSPLLTDTRRQLWVFMHFIWCYATVFYVSCKVFLMCNLKIINRVTLLE